MSLKKPREDEPVAAAGPFIELRGRVVWDTDDDPVARDQNLSVVAIANHVAHRPVVPAAAAGKRERTFVVPGLSERIGHSGADRASFRQADPGQCRNRESTNGILRSQRETSQGAAAASARRRRGGLGARPGRPLCDGWSRQSAEPVPADRPGFDRGSFLHPAFARAVLYRPLVSDVERSDLLGLLKDVEREIDQTTVLKGDEWVNDVVLVYYQGWDLMGGDGVQRCTRARACATSRRKTRSTRSGSTNCRPRPVSAWPC